MKKIALINQRYGLEVNGGSEYYTRKIAEKLKDYYEVEILTTKALSYETWENDYLHDIERINGVTVRRFTVKKKRSILLQKICTRLLRVPGIGKNILSKIWVNAQGPFSPDLISYLRQHRNQYDVFIFVTYLYYPTAIGMEEVADKAVLVPTAHDEFCIYYPVFRKLFSMPRALIYLTEEEKGFVQKNFHNENILNTVAGIGVELPTDISSERFRRKYGISGNYLIYAGRVDKSKGCREMTEYFLRFIEKQNRDIKLVILGQAFMEIPKNERICYLGFVSEEDKFDGIKGAIALWMPSQFESLSISVIEALALGIPVIVNGKSEVLKGHCIRSDAGFWYTDYKAFENAVLGVIEADMEKMAENAKNYIKNYFSWEKVIEEYKNIINHITS